MNHDFAAARGREEGGVSEVSKYTIHRMLSFVGLRPSDNSWNYGADLVRRGYRPWKIAEILGMDSEKVVQLGGPFRTPWKP